MNDPIGKTVDMVVRVRDFFRTRPFGAEQADAILVLFNEKVERIVYLVELESAGHADRHAATNARATLKEEIRTGNLRHLARIGKAAAEEKPELTGKFRVPRKTARESAFRATAHEILAAAAANKELLRKYGMGEGVLESLTSQLEAFDHAILAGNAARAAHTGARKELKGRASEAVRMVRQLEGMLLLQFPEDLNLQGAWESARNVARPPRTPEPEKTPSPEEPAA